MGDAYYKRTPLSSSPHSTHHWALPEGEDGGTTGPAHAVGHNEQPRRPVQRGHRNRSTFGKCCFLRSSMVIGLSPTLTGSLVLPHILDCHSYGDVLLLTNLWASSSMHKHFFPDDLVDTRTTQSRLDGLAMGNMNQNTELYCP